MHSFKEARVQPSRKLRILIQIRPQKIADICDDKNCWMVFTYFGCGFLEFRPNSNILPIKKNCIIVLHVQDVLSKLHSIPKRTAWHTV